MAKRSCWRLIRSGALSAPENMALDQALLDNFNPATSTPIFRLYEWKPAAISLGRFQESDKVVDMLHCDERQVDIVRRMTGGGAIFHHNELTYSIICGEKDLPNALTIKESYKTLTRFLFMTYQDLSLKADYACDLALTEQKYKLGEKTPICFAGWEPYDIIIQGKKIGGNAQLRKRDVLLQHGSLPLEIDFTLSKLLFANQTPNITATTTFLTAEGITILKNTLADLCIKNFSSSLEIEFLLSSPTTEETSTTQTLKKHKYMNKKWNLTRAPFPI